MQLFNSATLLRSAALTLTATTAITAQSWSSAPNVPIPDNTTFVDEIYVPRDQIITDLTVDLKYTHRLVWGTRIQLQHVGVTGNVTLYDHPNPVCGRDNFDVRFSDAATQGPSCHYSKALGQPNCETATAWAVTGIALPQQPLSAFDGTNMQGTWRLTIRDDLDQQWGYLCEWSLNFSDCESVASFETYGTGCGSTAMLLSSNGAIPVIGEDITIEVQGLPAAAAGTALLLGFTSASVDLSSLGMPTCLLETSSEFSMPLGGGAVPAVLFTIPDTCGAEVYMQAAALVPGLNALGVGLSPGARMVMGG